MGGPIVINAIFTLYWIIKPVTDISSVTSRIVQKSVSCAWMLNYFVRKARLVYLLIPVHMSTTIGVVIVFVYMMPSITTSSTMRQVKPIKITWRSCDGDWAGWFCWCPKRATLRRAIMLFWRSTESHRSSLCRFASTIHTEPTMMEWAKHTLS